MFSLCTGNYACDSNYEKLDTPHIQWLSYSLFANIE